MAKARFPEKLIMVADDDEDLAFLLAAQLEQAGYRVQKCMGGRNLVADVGKHQPQLLLLDIAMQEIDGSELCTELKSNKATAGVKILLMSGNHNLAEHTASCGADGYIAKPLSLQSLKTVISKYI